MNVLKRVYATLMIIVINKLFFKTFFLKRQRQIFGIESRLV